MSNGQVQAVQANAMKAYEGAKIQLHSLLNLTLHGSASSASRPGRFTSKQKAPNTHWIEAEWGPEEVLLFGKPINLFALLANGKRFLGFPAPNLVTTSNDLRRLRIKGYNLLRIKLYTPLTFKNTLSYCNEIPFVIDRDNCSFPELVCLTNYLAPDS